MTPCVKQNKIIKLTALALCLFLSLPLGIMADEVEQTAHVTESVDFSNDTAAVDSGAADSESADSEGLDSDSTEDTHEPEIITELHVMAGGEGDGRDSAHPLGDIADAYSAMPESGGKIVMHGKYEFSASSCHDAMHGSFTEPEHKGQITVTGEDAYLVFPENYRFYMSGATKFENIGLSGSGTFVLSARYNPLIMGEKITVIGISDGIILVGGYSGSNSGISDDALSGDTSIEIYSGSYKIVCGYNRTTTAKICTGSANISVHGGNVNCITAGFSGYNSAFTDNEMKGMNIRVMGGDVYKICDVDMATYGKLSELSLDYTGGEIRNILISADVESVISYSDEMASHVTGYLRYFDRYRQGEGESIETKKIKVAFIGDSITAGTGTNDPASESYPAQLGKMLGDAYEVGNFSEGGRCVLTNSGSPYFESEAFAQSLLFQPDVVCIMLGTNDLSALLSADEASDMLYRDMLVLIEKYTNLESKPIIYLLTPTVRTDDSALEGAICDFMLPVYKQIADELGVGYVDTYTVSCDMKHHFGDSVHPDAVACSYIATWLYNAIVSNSNISSTVADVSRVEVVLKGTEQDSPIAPDSEQQNGSLAIQIALALVLLSVGCGVTFLFSNYETRYRIFSFFDRTHHDEED